MSLFPSSDRPERRRRWGPTRLLRLVLPLAVAGLLPTAGIAEAPSNHREDPSDVGSTPPLEPLRSWLGGHGLELELVYTGDYLVNTRGGVAQRGEFLGNVDLTLTWHTGATLDRDLGTFFLYGLYDHGGRPSDAVGDIQIVDNIEASDGVRLYEAWWQKTFLDGRASILLGLYDVNSEFYVVESALPFLHSSFGIGGAVGNSGVEGPSIFPATSLGARLKAEVADGWEVLAAVLDGVPGDPERGTAVPVRFGKDDGVFAIAEVARAWRPREALRRDGVERTPRRRAIGRALDVLPYALRVAAGTWVYSARRDVLSPGATPQRERGHPGIYLTADFDASVLDPFDAQGLGVFVQAGWADEDVDPFQAYLGGGLTYTGLVPTRGADVCGFGVAAAFAGNALKSSIRAEGARPAAAEIALEWTYRARILRWLTLQGDLQLVIDPGARRDRPDALVTGLRFIVEI